MATTQWAFDDSTTNLRRLDNELRGHLRKRGRTTAEIESVVSRTWLAVGRVFRGECSLRHFLYVVLNRQLIDYDRAARRRARFGGDDEVVPDHLTSEDLSTDSQMFRQATMERFHSALAEIPRHYAEVVELVLQGHSQLVIAEKLGIEYNTVRSRYSRGKARLLELLAHDDG